MSRHSPLTCQYGYRVGELTSIFPEPVWDQAVGGLTIYPQYNHRRQVVARDLGPTLPATLPMADRYDQKNMVYAIKSRMLRMLPPHERYDLVRSTSRLVLRKQCSELRIPADFIIDQDKYIDDLPHSENRKNQLREAKIRMLEDPSYKIDAVEIHIKPNDAFEKFAKPRGIYARSDGAKVKYGSVVHVIEERVFQLPYFVKKVPVSQRAKYIYDYMDGKNDRLYNYYVTDYSNFEAQLSPELMNVCECQLYKYMTSRNKEAKEVMERFCSVITGEQQVWAPNLQAWMMGKRQSGEVSTSLGNGWTNLIMAMTVCRDHGIPFEKFCGVFEGDDGVIRTPRDVVLTANDFARYGMVIKIKKVPNITQAEFCGLIFSDKDLSNIKDPIWTLVGYGWSRSSLKYVKSKRLVDGQLLAKAICAICEAPRCPIVKPFMLKMLQLTKWTNPIYDNDWWEKYVMKEFDQEKILENRLFWQLVGEEIPLCNRSVMQDYYGISIGDQLRIENEIANIQDLSALKLPTLRKYIPLDWIMCYDRYVNHYAQVPYQKFW